MSVQITDEQRMDSYYSECLTMDLLQDACEYIGHPVDQTGDPINKKTSELSTQQRTSTNPAPSAQRGKKLSEWTLGALNNIYREKQHGRTSRGQILRSPVH